MATTTVSKYLAASRKIPNSIGLSLSGGGFRATLFHLGALRRLHELGILAKVTTISSVSGGSILNGWLAARVSAHSIGDFEAEVAAPIRAFCAHNIRRWLALEAFLPGTHNSHGLAAKYDEMLTARKKLVDISAAPVHVFCATDLAYGVNWMFKRLESGDYQVGFMPTPANWSVGMAVAASSCFPPVFQPLKLDLDPTKLTGGRIPPGAERDKNIRNLTLSDGGVYDNLGLEPIWKDHEVVLSSDGGALFPHGGDTGFVWEVSRYIAIPENQALAVRKRWLVSNFIARQLKGTYWGIGGSRAEYDAEGGYGEAVAKQAIAAIRTDLDSFSETEAAILENHGYGLADAAIAKWVPGLVSVPAPFNLPHQAWDVADDKIREALRDSGRRTLLGRTG